MKNVSKLLGSMAVGGGLALSAMGGEWDWQNRVYAKFDAGAAWTSSTAVKELFGPAPAGTRAEFNTGARIGLGLGYNVTDWFAAELETGVFGNSVRRITGLADVDADFYNTPVLVNVRLQLPNPTIVTPFIGVGAGGASSILDIDHLDTGTTRFWGSTSDTVFAWQAFGGISVAVSQHVHLAAEYRYFRADGPTFDVDWGWWSGRFSNHIKFDDIATHAVSVRLDITF